MIGIALGRLGIEHSLEPRVVSVRYQHARGGTCQWPDSVSRTNTAWDRSDTKCASRGGAQEQLMSVCNVCLPSVCLLSWFLGAIADLGCHVSECLLRLPCPAVLGQSTECPRVMSTARILCSELLYICGETERKSEAQQRAERAPPAQSSVWHIWVELFPCVSDSAQSPRCSNEVSPTAQGNREKDRPWTL